ncbi:MAG: DnaJ-like protein DjlA [bacterium ADurb.Bin243]|nr:MAG: DnaJ-like protein DjlA [bacterium ADurb.Bin243]HOD41339.1 TerB family tellurite resistance protein [Candidatus Wallbacteria bacterium]
MGGGGAILGGLFGLMLGGPIGGIIGAVFGNAISETGTAENGRGAAECPGCGANVLVGGRGRWICPNCRTAFIYDGRDVLPDSEAGYGGYEKNRAGEDFNREQSQEIFFLVVFSLLALMAKADGIVSREEIKLVDDFIKKDLQLSSEKRDMAIKIFNAAKDSGYSFEGLASQFYSIFKNERNVLMTMFGLLVHLAYSDGEFHPNEERLIISAKNIFKISDYEYESYKTRYGSGQNSSGGRDNFESGHSEGSIASPAKAGAESYYAVLGCQPSDSIEKIKEAYKKMVKDYHPDNIIAKGLPEDFVKFATQRFQQIQDAYEKIKKARNF